MNREEAIANLNMISVAFVDPVTKEQRKLIDDTFEMAIKALEQEPKILETLDFAINASDGDTTYFVGFRNGLRYSKSLIDGEEPQFENCTEQEPCGDAIDRAEAIKIASGYCHPANVAKELAKLPPVNPQPCEDAISRQAAIDVIDNWEASHSWDSWCYGHKDKANEYNISAPSAEIDKLPSVTPQPKTGHWIMSEDGLYRPICDVCCAHPWKGYIPTVEEATEVFKYCPNCGAKMVEPQERSDKE